MLQGQAQHAQRAHRHLPRKILQQQAHAHAPHHAAKRIAQRTSMDSMELILTDLSEEATKRLAEKKKPQGLYENIDVAKLASNATKLAREDLEKNLGETIINKDNKLNYKYKENKQKSKKQNFFVVFFDISTEFVSVFFQRQ